MASAATRNCSYSLTWSAGSLTLDAADANAAPDGDPTAVDPAGGRLGVTGTAIVGELGDDATAGVAGVAVAAADQMDAYSATVSLGSGAVCNAAAAAAAADDCEAPATPALLASAPMRVSTSE